MTYTKIAQMAAKNWNIVNDISTELLAQIQNNLKEMFIIRPSTKIAQTVLLCWTNSKWSPKLTIEIS